MVLHYIYGMKISVISMNTGGQIEETLKERNEISRWAVLADIMITISSVGTVGQATANFIGVVPNNLRITEKVQNHLEFKALMNFFLLLFYSLHLDYGVH